MDEYNKKLNYEEIICIYPNIDRLLNFELSCDFKLILDRFKNFSGDIFSCYNFFNDFPKNTYLAHIFEKFLFSGDDIFNLPLLLKQISSFTKDNLDKYTIYEVYTSLLIILFIYLRESVYGPSLFYIKETEKVDYSKELHNFTNHKLFILEKRANRNHNIEYLTIMGEIPYTNAKLLTLFIIVYELIINSNLFDCVRVNKLWKIRLLFLHNKLIKDPIDTLKNDILKLYKDINFDEFNIFNEANLIKGLLVLEKSHYMLKYFKYKESEELIDEAKSLFNLKINLTGRLGKKTKYQEFEIPILVVESESSTLNCHKENTDNQPNKVKLDDENPLLEIPFITDQTLLNSTDLSLYDQIYVNSYLNYIKKSLPDEELLREIIVTYVNKCLNKSFDWLVYSKILFFKCLAEDKKSKTIERCLLQIQSLCDQYNDRSPLPYERLKYCLIIEYPYLWDLKKIYAEAFMNFGAVMTAFEIYKEIEMYEECIQCLYIAGKNQRAQEFADQILKFKQDPGIYCILGEINNDEKYFFKALEISDNKYTRAYRCLGKFYSTNKNLPEAIKYYEKALEINPLFPSIWFSLGCLYLQRNECINACKSFSKSVQIDETSAESWANLGSTFSQMGKHKEALKCLEEGFKLSKKDWRMCENIMYVSIDCKDISKLIFAINNLFILDKHDRLKPAIYFTLINFYIKGFSNLDDYMRKYYKERIYDIFNTFAEKDGINSEVWDLYIYFIQSVEIECNKLNNLDDIQNFYKKMIDLRMKQIRTHLIPEWEKDEKVIDKLKEVLKKIKEELKMITEEIFYKEKNSFIQSIETKIERYFKIKEYNG